MVLNLMAQNSLLQSGPMVGYCEMTEAKIWVQTTTAAQVKIMYSPVDNTKEVHYSNEIVTNKDSGYTAHLILDQLTPGKNITIQFTLIIKKSAYLTKLHFLPKNFGNGEKMLLILLWH
jgi:alkaline phosphatase D